MADVGWAAWLVEVHAPVGNVEEAEGGSDGHSHSRGCNRSESGDPVSAHTGHDEYEKASENASGSSSGSEMESESGSEKSLHLAAMASGGKNGGKWRHDAMMSGYEGSQIL